MHNPLLGEFIGTFVLIAFGSGVGASINLKGTHANAVGKNWLLVAFGWGVAVMLGVYSSAFFGSPGHLNPAVTIGFASAGIFSDVFRAGDVVPFIIAQFIGAFLGALFIAIQFYPHFKATAADEGNSVGIFATGPAIDAPAWNFLSEVMSTFIFIFVLLLATNSGQFADGLVPIMLVFLLVGIAFSFGSTTGYAINPARDLGPRLMYTLIPLPNKNKDYNWKYAWVPLFGPIVGGIIASLLFQALN